MNRRTEFVGIIYTVLGHITNYTIPQYGDIPDDELSHWSTEQCMKAIQKYTARHSAGRRGRLETLRDCIKIIHFATVVFWKMKPTLQEVKVIERGGVLDEDRDNGEEG